MAKPERLQQHHILHERWSWDARPESRCLRRSSGLIVRLAQAPHSELHDNTPPVPIPNIYMLRNIQRGFVPSPDIHQAIDNFCFSVEDAGTHYKATDFDRRLGELMIEAVRSQLPYIENVGNHGKDTYIRY